MSIYFPFIGVGDIMASYKQIAKYNWKVDISLGYDNGKRKRIIKQGFRTKGDAEKFATEILNKKNLGYSLTTTTNILFKDFINQWFDEYKSKTLSINTKTNYKSRINNHIIPYLGNLKLSQINNITIQNFYNNLIGSNNAGLKPASAKKVIEILNGCFKYASKNKLISFIPTDIEKLKCEKPQIEFWTKDEIDFYLKTIKNTYLYTPIFIEILTGLRIGELCGLRWCDIDFNEGYLYVNNQVILNRETKELVLSNVLKTSTANRSISIPNILINYLKELKSKLNANEYDFIIKSRDNKICNPRNLSMNFTKSINKYTKSLEEKKKESSKYDSKNYMQLKQISFHSLRHTHATLLIFNGENIKVVSDRLGHKDISVTLNTYTHIMEDMKKGTASLLDSIFKL